MLTLPFPLNSVFPILALHPHFILYFYFKYIIIAVVVFFFLFAIVTISPVPCNN